MLIQGSKEAEASTGPVRRPSMASGVLSVPPLPSSTKARTSELVLLLLPPFPSALQKGARTPPSLHRHGRCRWPVLDRLLEHMVSTQTGAIRLLDSRRKCCMHRRMSTCPTATSER